MKKNDVQKTPISFKGYRIIRLKYGINIDPNKNDMKIRYGISKDKKMGQVTITVRFNDESKKAYGLLEVAGQFDLSPNLTEEQQRLYVGQNGSAILYPYVRSIVSMITSLDDNHVQLLPTLNFVNLVKNNKIQKE